MDYITLILSIASAVLAVMAIILSIVFYKWSIQSYKDIQHETQSMKNSVDKLEKLFDKMYEGTFSMMKETVSDMRQHLWPESKISKEFKKEEKDEINIRILDLQKDTEKKISTLVKGLTNNEKKVSELQSKMSPVVSNLIKQSVNIERQIKENKIRNRILEYLNEHPICRARDIVLSINPQFGVRSIIEEIYALRKDKIINIDPKVKNVDDIDPSSKITLQRIHQIMASSYTE